MQVRAIVAIADQYKVVYDISIGAIFNDLERPPNPDFKVMPIFDAEYLSNGIEDRDGRPIGIRMRSIEWCHFQ